MWNLFIKFFKDSKDYSANIRLPEKPKNTKKIDNQFVYSLDKCEEFSDIFELVKKVVKETFNQHRVGLMLVLADLPISVGAFHALGSNTIVMNRTLLIHFEKSESKYKKEFIFLVLLHEYLHSLGHTNEAEVKLFSYRIVAKAFGVEHPLTHIAENGPFSILPRLPRYGIYGTGENPELIKGFEKNKQTYIQ